MGVAVAVGPPGNWLVILMHVMQRGRARVRGPGAAGALQAAVRDVSVTTLTQSRRTHAGTCKAAAAAGGRRTASLYKVNTPSCACERAKSDFLCILLLLF